jgi:hypothetical protein
MDVPEWAAGIKVGMGVRSTNGAAWLQVKVKPQDEIYTMLNHKASIAKNPRMVP